jgi:dihydrofolate reductase
VVFPPLDLSQWTETRRERHASGPGDDHDFTVLTYDRRR